MAATIRDWQAHGVSLKVELAVSGSLVLGGNQTDFPFVQGGSNGAPQGWTPAEYFSGPADNVGAYSFSTSSGGVFSVTPVTTSARSAGIWSPVFPVIPGKRYAIIGQARQMASKATSHRVVRIDTGATLGTINDYYTGVAGTAQTDWEDILATSVGVVPAGHVYGTIMILGSPPSAAATNWGCEFQNIAVKELADEPEPLEWVDVTCDVQSIVVRYGRERFTNRYDVSTMQLDLLNQDGKYSFHPNHPLGLKPGRQVRVTATYQGIDYPMAFHVLDSLVDAYGLDGSVVSRWSCIDPTTTLSQQEVASTVAPALKGGSRIGYLLDQVGYFYRLLDPGVWNMQKIVANGRTIRDEAGVTADSEGGNFFADRLGNVVYKDRTWPTVDIDLQQVTADLVAYPHEGPVMPIVDDVPTQEDAPLICVRELITDWSLARVINWVSLANAGGTAKTYVDEESLQAYGPHTYSRHDFVLTSSSFLDTRAADIMTGYSEPVLRVNSIAYAPGMSGAWEFTFKLFLNWLVRIWYSHPTNYWGYAVCVHVQSIEHRITPTDWLTALTVDLPESFVEIQWAIGYGWDEGLWDENLWDQDTMTIAGIWNEPTTTLWDAGDIWGN